MKAGLYGKQTHVSPERAISGLDSNTAKKKLGDNSHSIWELLHHIVVWQDVTIDAINGKDVDWKEVHARNWPSNKELLSDSDWEKLVKQFYSGLEEMEKIIESGDFARIIPEWKAPVAEGLLVVLQHNSYHLGQIVSVRQATGTWVSLE